MLSNALLHTEAEHYRMLADELKTDFAGIDEETLADTLEGVSELPDLLKAVLRSSLLDEALAEGLKGRLGEMKVRLERLEDRSSKKRDLVSSSMGKAGLAKLMAEDFSASLRLGPPRLEVKDEAKIPTAYLVPQPARLDRAGLLLALKQGKAVEGASLGQGLPHLQVRTK